MDALVLIICVFILLFLLRSIIETLTWTVILIYYGVKRLMR